MHTLTYPDGEQILYEYDFGGKLSGMSAFDGTYRQAPYYIQQLTYDKFGKRASMIKNSLVEATYTYDTTNQRLSRLKDNLDTNGHFQDITYSYDNADNITAVTNNIPVPAHGYGGPASQAYTTTTSAPGHRNIQNPEQIHVKYGLQRHP
jgi:hypothetical protein